MVVLNADMFVMRCLLYPWAAEDQFFFGTVIYELTFEMDFVVFVYTDIPRVIFKLFLLQISSSVINILSGIITS